MVSILRQQGIKFAWNCSFKSIYHVYFYVILSRTIFFRSKIEQKELDALDEISSCSKTIANTSLDQSAYFMGMAELKGIDFDKYRKKAKQQLQKDQQEKDEKKKGNLK